MFDVIYFNQYLGIKLVHDGCDDVLQIQQQKIKKGFKKLRLEDNNTIKAPIKDYLQLLLDEYQVLISNKV